LIGEEILITRVLFPLFRRDQAMFPMRDNNRCF